MTHRYESARLFQTVRAALEPARIGGSAWSNETCGPTHKYVDLHAGWPWDNVGGDYIDAAQVRQGPLPWLSVLTTTAPAPKEFSADATAALQFIQTNGRWNAFLLKCTAPRKIAGLGAGEPRIDVVYASGPAVLACRIVAVNSSSSSAPQTKLSTYSLPIFLEFDKPTEPVLSATLSFTVTAFFSGSNPYVQGFILDPTVNTAPVEQGLASCAPLDANLPGHSGIIGVHRYMDGSVPADFFHPTPISTDAEESFDPFIYGTGPQDLTKLPHLALGKWINGAGVLIDSAYSGEGFEPLAPGVGALKVHMPKVPGVTDGSLVGYNGTVAANARIYLPEPLFCNLDRIFVRHYFRFAPTNIAIADRFHVRPTANVAPLWSNCTGKLGIMPSHTTTDGGVSGSSGGGFGWQMRLGWADFTSDDAGPDHGGMSVFLHTTDFQVNNPLGHRYGQTDQPKDYYLSQRGGMGILMPNRWYGLEAEVQLNSVAPYAEDGYIKVWVDGRLVFHRTGMVMRKLPLYNPGFRASKSRPCRQLGHKDLWFNWFHGGKTWNTIDRTMFVTAPAWGTSYIGPMRLA